MQEKSAKNNKDLDINIQFKQINWYVGLRNLGSTCYMNSLL